MTHTMAFPIALWALFLFLSGCAGTQAIYEKSGITQAEREQDINECARTAMGTSEGWRWPLFQLYQIDREDYQKCLEARGYTLTPTVSPPLREPVQAP